MRLQQHFCCGCTDDIGSLQELIDTVEAQRMVYLSTCKGDVAFVVGEGHSANAAIAVSDKIQRNALGREYLAQILP